MFKKFTIESIICHYNTLAFGAGVITVFAFAPYYCYPLALLGLVGLLFSWVKSTSNKASFWRGFYYGLGFFATAVYWVSISIYQFGHAPWWLTGLMTGLLIVVLALFPALVGYCLQRFYPNNHLPKLCLAFPALWCLSEWFRSWLFTGFPWCLLGDSQTNLLFSGLAPITGTIGISFILAHSAGVINLALLKSLRSWRQTVCCIIYLIVLITGLLCLNLFQWVQPTGEPIKVSLVQGNIKQSLKWDPAAAQRTIETYQELSQTLLKPDKLVIWPESAVPISLPFSAKTIAQLKTTAEQQQAGLILGIPMQSADGHSNYNGAIGLGTVEGAYLKRRLVPFGEFFPAAALSHIILRFINLPMSDFSAGKPIQAAMQLGDTKLAVFICYEIAFGELVNSTLNHSRANMIVLLSDDAWFGHSSAQAQQLQMAQMRAMETGRYVLSATNNGLTAVINHHGIITARTAPYQRTVLSTSAQAMTGETPWLRWGMNSILTLCLLALYFAKKLEKRFA